LLCAAAAGAALAAPPASTHGAANDCRSVVFEGDVRAGESYEHVFAKGLRFYLEPLASGWIVRVLSTTAPRSDHDFAELATPPYRSVSPLLISTDWAFRSQDAIAWNPRRFRYAADGATFTELAKLYPSVMANDGGSSVRAAQIVASQPGGILRILDARLSPGAADQAKMASMVAEHLAQTPTIVDRMAKPSPLGRIEEMRFRLELDLPESNAGGVTAQKNLCKVPTTE
jgi:hypothetical protein